MNNRSAKKRGQVCIFPFSLNEEQNENGQTFAHSTTRIHLDYFMLKNVLRITILPFFKKTDISHNESNNKKKGQFKIRHSDFFLHFFSPVERKKKRNNFGI